MYGEVLCSLNTHTHFREWMDAWMDGTDGGLVELVSKPGRSVQETLLALMRESRRRVVVVCSFIHAFSSLPLGFSMLSSSGLAPWDPIRCNRSSYLIGELPWTTAIFRYHHT